MRDGFYIDRAGREVPVAFLTAEQIAAYGNYQIAMTTLGVGLLLHPDSKDGFYDDLPVGEVGHG